MKIKNKKQFLYKNLYIKLKANNYYYLNLFFF